jgi:dephospho-CoA kinase
MIDAKGALDRPAMRRLVFDDPAARSRLEAILHPAIRVEADLRCLHSVAPYVLLVVPLLVETGGYLSRVERVVVVDCPEEVQVMRTVSRSGIPAEQVRTIMAAQASREARLAVADDVIDNTGDEAALRRHVLRLHQDYLVRAATE